MQLGSDTIGAVVNASVVEDRERFARVAVFFEETTGFGITQDLHEGRQLEDFIIGLGTMFELIRMGPHREPPTIQV